MQDRINMKQSKGMWKRYIKLLFRVRLPLLSILVYVLSDIFLIQVGISEVSYTAELFAGNVSVELITALVTIILINVAAGALSAMIRQATTAHIDRNTRLAIWEKVLHIPMEFFKEQDPQETITRIVGNATRVSSSITSVIVPIFTTGYSLALSVLKVFKYDTRLAMTLLLFIPLTIITAAITGRLKYSASKAGAKVGSVLTEQLSELIINVPLAKAFAREDREEKRAKQTTERQYRIGLKMSWIGQLSDLSFSLLTLLQTITVIFIGWMLVRDQQIEKRVWVTFFMFSSVCMSNINTLVIYWHSLKTIQGGIDRVAEIMDYPSEKETGKASDTMGGDICVENVCFGYDPESPVLNDINCTFRQGKITALLGRSGCGKTTLLNVIDRIYRPQSGCIRIGTHDATDYVLSGYRGKMAVISQVPVVFSGSIRNNLCFGLQQDKSDDCLWEALEKVGLAAMVRRLPNGLNADIGERGNKLSGGQKQCLALARMLLQDAPYILLDEATASMDPVAIQGVKEVLKKMLAGKTAIIIMHTPQLMDLVDEVVVIENGKVSYQGPVDGNNSFLRCFMKGEVENA